MAQQTTVRKIVSDLHKTFKQTFDDSDISFNQVAHWTQFFINKFQALKMQTVDSGLYLSIYPNVPVVSPTTSVSPNIVSGRKYIVLPSAIHDFDNDGGIKYISYTDFDESCQPSFAGVRFTRTSTTKAKRLYGNPYESPSPNNPYFYRVRDNIYLLGVDNISVNFVEVGIHTIFDPFDETNLDVPVYLDEALISDVYKNVFELGRFAMLIPSEVVNEGADQTSPDAALKQRVVSVNQPGVINNQEQ